MVRVQLYERPVDRRTPCRRHLFPDSVFRSESQPLLPGLCLCDVSRKLGVELWSCGKCGSDWLSKAKGVIVCPLPTKATKESLATPSGSSVKQPSLFATFPELWAFLTCYTSPDGSKRQGGKLSLSCDAGVWSLTLMDPSTTLYACLQGSDVEDLILMVEARLAESTLPWRVSSYSPKGRR
jgi:hypothetical protein